MCVCKTFTERKFGLHLYNIVNIICLSRIRVPDVRSASDRNTSRVRGLNLGSCRGLELGTSGAIYQRVKLPTLMRTRARPLGKLISLAILPLPAMSTIADISFKKPRMCHIFGAH